MAIYVHKISDGTLVSWCPEDTDPVAPDDELEAQGLAKKIGLPPLDETHAWDASQQTVIEVEAPIKPNEVTTAFFVLLFTPQEYDDISNAKDIEVRHFWAAVQSSTPTIDLNNPKTQAGIGHMVDVGILTQGAADAILAGEERS